MIIIVCDIEVLHVDLFDTAVIDKSIARSDIEAACHKIVLLYIETFVEESFILKY